MAEDNRDPVEDRNTIEKVIGGREAAEAEDEAAGNPILEEDRVNVDEIEPDFMNEELETDPIPVIEDDEGEVYAPPTDPVVTTDRWGQTQVLGGTSPSALDPDVGPALSAEDNQPGDEALVDAIREHLRLDATTTELESELDVSVRDGIAYLHGRVTGPEDADNVEAVVASVPGVRDVVEELRVTEL